MSVFTVRACDSATAMDEVIRRLGPDALILSTRARDGQVEIVASDGQDAPAPQPKAVAGPVAAPPAEPEPGPGVVAHGFAAYLARAAAAPPPMRAVAPSGDLSDRPARADLARAVLRAPRVVLVGPLGAGKSALAMQIAAERLADDGAAPDASAARAPAFVFCGSGSHCDGAWLAQKALLLGAEMGFAAAETLAPPRAGIADLVVVSDLHPDAATATRAVLQTEGALALLVLPAGLRADRAAQLIAPWRALVVGAVLTCAPGETAAPEDAEALAAAGLVPLWASRRGGLLDALGDPPDPATGGQGAGPVPMFRAHRPQTLTDRAG